MSSFKALTPNDRVKRRADVVSGEVAGEAVLVTPSQARVRMLNEVGSRVWDLADGEMTLQQMADVLVSEYQVTPDLATADVLAFVEELVAADLVEVLSR